MGLLDNSWVPNRVVRQQSLGHHFRTLSSGKEKILTTVGIELTLDTILIIGPIGVVRAL